jgi:hypothetical protein
LVLADSKKVEVLLSMWVLSPLLLAAAASPQLKI